MGEIDIDTALPDSKGHAGECYKLKACHRTADVARNPLVFDIFHKHPSI